VTTQLQLVVVVVVVVVVIIIIIIIITIITKVIRMIVGVKAEFVMTNSIVQDIRLPFPEPVN
jgi:hypothetical protein